MTGGDVAGCASAGDAGAAAQAGGDPLHLVYVRPSFGGIFDYSETVLGILRREYPEARIAVITARQGRSHRHDGRRLAEEIRALPGTVLADLGSGDAGMFWALRRIARTRRLLLTIHDPGVVVRLFHVGALATGPWPLPILEWYLDRAARVLIGDRLISGLLRNAAARIVLNRSITELGGLPLTFLPQPVYVAERVAYAPPARPKIAFLGYWDPSKGLEELLTAYRSLLPRVPDARFVIAGGGPVSDDPYDASVRARARESGPRIELPGFVPPGELREFLRGLSALVLPYHPSVPGAASAMLMRAQELGVPLILSNTPRLRAQVDPANVTLVPPRDSDALVAALTEHLDDAARFVARAQREQERVHAEHSHAAVGAKLRALLEELP